MRRRPNKTMVVKTPKILPIDANTVRRTVTLTNSVPNSTVLTVVGEVFEYQHGIIISLRSELVSKYKTRIGDSNRYLIL